LFLAETTLGILRYSSLSFLKELPIDKVKIDSSLIKNIGKNEENSSIILAIISLCKNLNIKVSIEGIEQDEQLKFITKNGCDIAQGYLFFKALDIEELEKILLRVSPQL